jgi:hypothetical protein
MLIQRGTDRGGKWCPHLEVVAWHTNPPAVFQIIALVKCELTVVQSSREHPITHVLFPFSGRDIMGLW